MQFGQVKCNNSKYRGTKFYGKKQQGMLCIHLKEGMIVWVGELLSKVLSQMY